MSNTKLDEKVNSLKSKELILLERLQSYEKLKEKGELSGNYKKCTLWQDGYYFSNDILTSLVVPEELAEIFSDLSMDEIANYYGPYLNEDDIVSISTEVHDLYHEQLEKFHVEIPEDDYSNPYISLACTKKDEIIREGRHPKISDALPGDLEPKEGKPVILYNYGGQAYAIVSEDKAIEADVGYDTLYSYFEEREVDYSKLLERKEKKSGLLHDIKNRPNKNHDKEDSEI